MGTSLVSSWKTSSWNTSSAVNNRTSLCIGLSKYDGGRWRLPLSSKFPSAISNLTFLTYPSSLGYTCTTLPSGHLLRVLSLSLEMTISPTARFLLGWTHFCLTCNIWRYSPRHLSQNSFARYWTLLQRLQQYISALWNFPGGGSSGASAPHKLSTLRGLELIMHSTSIKSVRNVASSSWLPACNSSGSSALRTLRIKPSHVPPMWLEWTYVQLEWNPLASIP